MLVNLACHTKPLGFVDKFRDNSAERGINGLE